MGRAFGPPEARALASVNAHLEFFTESVKIELRTFARFFTNRGFLQKIVTSTSPIRAFWPGLVLKSDALSPYIWEMPVDSAVAPEPTGPVIRKTFVIMPVLLSLLLLGALFLAYRLWSGPARRRRLLATPLTDDQRATIDAHVPLLRKLPQDLRPALEGRINRFLDQVEFIGCNGLDVTEEMRLSIAAQACLVVVNSDQWFDTLRTILVYPDAFKSLQKRQEGYVVTEREGVRIGESWARGPIVLSWRHSDAGARDDTDGHNVILHEFAHQLDQLSGHVDGAPLLARGQSFDDWSRVFLTAFARLQKSVEAGRSSVLDAYAATSHQEFFAVAVEVFFERPHALRQEAPEVYDQIAELLRLDPARWV